MMMLLQRHRYDVLLVLLAVFLVGTACANQPPQLNEVVTAPEEPTPTIQTTGRGAGDTLQILSWDAPTILNPHLSANSKDTQVSRIIYEPLASFDNQDNLVPFLAAEIPSLENGDLAEDLTSVTWRLKREVFWSDGQPFTADDVRFTYEFITDPNVGSFSEAVYSAVKDVEVIDDYTIRVHFHAPNPAWSLPFVGTYGMILPRHVFEDFSGSDIVQAPANYGEAVGTGPYRVVSFRPQEVIFLGTELIETNKIIFEPNEYFREEDKPYFRRIELRGGGTIDEAARAVLSEGRVDYAYNLSLPAADLEALVQGGTGRLVTNFGAKVEMIDVNHTDPFSTTADGERSSLEIPHPFFQDKRVRQAIAHAIDREAIAELYGEIGRPTSNILVAPRIYRSPRTYYEFDLEKAATLLDEAGWTDSDNDGIRDKNGNRLSIVFQTIAGDVRQQTQEIVRRNLGRIGVEVRNRFYDASVFYGNPVENPNAVDRFQADLQEFDISSISPEPALFLQYWTTSQIPQKENNWRAGFNSARWYNPAYDALLERATAETDLQRRREMFIKLNDILIEDVAIIPLVHQADVSGVSTTIEGLDLTPWDEDLWNIKDWRRTEP